MTVAGTIDNTYGLLYVAVVVSTALYGVGAMQFWLYIRKYHLKDTLLIKCLVIAILVCDTCQQVLLIHSVYKYLVGGISDPAILPSVVETLMVQLFFSCAIATMVQQFYCWRIYKIGQNIFLALAVSAVSWTSCVVLMIYAARAVRFKQLGQLTTLQTLSIVSNTLSAAADVTVSVVLVILLQVSKTGFKRSTDLINRLMIFTFNTGLPTSMAALAATICVAAFPNTFLYIFFFLLLGRFYTNSILVTLNSREYIKSTSDPASQEHYSLENSGRPRPPQAGTLNGGQRDAITIRIETDTMHDYHSSSQDLKA
ncbi:hypothetical protein FB45DRAFT_98095 [Roridomyces roridus]|uniref:DUF6534 domain-containing protein n=1 Tax=Roridomyces roridus TaxID=1738132 RepID=A0AAD7FIW5_9AGAR|nr:hypothetical protein FB45DRAFT_98095 [Roridomyces roridus]